VEQETKTGLSLGCFQVGVANKTNCFLGMCPGVSTLNVMQYSSNIITRQCATDTRLHWKILHCNRSSTPQISCPPNHPFSFGVRDPHL